MDIWTEQLQPRHLPILTNWIGRKSGAMTRNDFPNDAKHVPLWMELSTGYDYLISVYETPVGIAGLRRNDAEAAELYLLLCEVNYNLIRTATYATLRMLDRAFENYSRVIVWVNVAQTEYRDALERMGFFQIEDSGSWRCMSVEKETYLGRKYLF